MLMTDNFIPHECETRKRRRVEQGDTVSFEETSIGTNPVQQLDRLCMIAPNFNCAAVLNDQVHRLQLSNLLLEYKAVVLFFYECDLYVCQERKKKKIKFFFC